MDSETGRPQRVGPPPSAPPPPSQPPRDLLQPWATIAPSQSVQMTAPPIAAPQGSWLPWGAGDGFGGVGDVRAAGGFACAPAAAHMVPGAPTAEAPRFPPPGLAVFQEQALRQAQVQQMQQGQLQAMPPTVPLVPAPSLPPPVKGPEIPVVRPEPPEQAPPGPAYGFDQLPSASSEEGDWEEEEHRLEQRLEEKGALGRSAKVQEQTGDDGWAGADEAAKQPRGGVDSRVRLLDLAKSIFKLCDVDEDGWLNKAEMRQFAEFKGFKGDDDAWTKEYTHLCRDVNSDPKKGLDLKFFAELVENPSYGCNLEVFELRDMLAALRDKADAGRRESEGEGRSNRRPGGSPTGVQSAGRDYPNTRGELRRDRGDRGDRGAEKDGENEMPLPEGQDFYIKLKRTVVWYNKNGDLADPIDLRVVADSLAAIRAGQAMRILYELDAKLKTCETPMKNATEWIVHEAQKRRTANESRMEQSGAPRDRDGQKDRGDRDGDKDQDRAWRRAQNADGYASTYQPRTPPRTTDKERGSSGKGGKQAASGYANAGLDRPRQQRGPPGNITVGGNREEDDEQDEFRSKLKRTINWYNRHGGLLNAIRYQDVIDGLNGSDPRLAMRILNDLDQANAEAVLNEPTTWILDELKRRGSGGDAQKGEKGRGRTTTTPAEAAATTTSDAAKTKVSSSKPGSLTAAMPSRLGPGLTALPGRLGPGGRGPSTPFAAA